MRTNRADGSPSVVTEPGKDGGPAGDAFVRIESLVKSYEKGVRAVDALDLTIGRGEFLVLLGPSGCGKTTTMRCLVGLETPDEGRITVGDQTLFDQSTGVEVPIYKRGMGMVFQSYAIWPHKTVAQNVSFPLEMQRVSKSVMAQRVEEMLEVVGLDGFGERPASNLSGGQMQRVALARSLVMQPSVLLLDEPLSNLDAKLRDRLRFELRELQQALGITSIYVTHDQAEALALADRIAVMRGGRIEQLEDPISMYLNPRNEFVADFLGTSNIFDGTVDAADGTLVQVTLTVPDAETGVPVRATAAPGEVWSRGEKVRVAIRPEGIGLRAAPLGEEGPSHPAHVKLASFLGSHIRYRVELDHGPALDINAPLTGPQAFRAGDPAHVVIPADSVKLLKD